MAATDLLYAIIRNYASMVVDGELSFANQHLSLGNLAEDGRTMEPGASALPPAQDQAPASITLATGCVKIGKLTFEQRHRPCSGRSLRLAVPADGPPILQLQAYATQLRASDYSSAAAKRPIVW